MKHQPPRQAQKILDTRFYMYHGDLSQPNLGLLIMNGRAYLPSSIDSVIKITSLDLWTVLQELYTHRTMVASQLGGTVEQLIGQLQTIQQKLLAAGAQPPTGNFLDGIHKK